MDKPLVVLGFFGTTLDSPRGTRGDRWARWRPTLDLCRQEELVVDRLELFVSPRHRGSAESLLSDLAAVSPETEVRVHDLEFEDPWDFGEVFEKTDDFARAYDFRPEEEEYLVHITTGTHVAQICLFLLCETRRIPGRLVQTWGPKRGAEGQPGGFAILDLDLSKYDRLARRFAREHEEDTDFLKQGIQTRNVAFNALIDRIERVAIGSGAPILLTGPTGAGKSQLARRIHELKARRRATSGPFVEVNCATLRGEGAMSALFGHVKGAFTGAVGARDGLLKAAHQGVLFLDEIGELGLDEQAMLLHALENGRFFPVGADQESQSSFQLLAGTNRDLRTAVREGRFREDLLARIDLWTFRLPGLAERPEDIEPNLDWELERWEETHGQRVRFNREARERFLSFATSGEARWTANFRDFNAALTRLATLAPGGRVDQAQIAEEIERLRESWSGSESKDADAHVLARHLEPEQRAELDRFDEVQLAEVLRICERTPSLSAAGRQLFGASLQRRASKNDADRVRKYLLRFGIDWRARRADR